MYYIYIYFIYKNKGYITMNSCQAATNQKKKKIHVQKAQYKQCKHIKMQNENHCGYITLNS